QVHARFARGGRPPSRGTVPLIPVGAVAELACAAEALHVFHQCARIADLHAGLWVAEDTVEGIAGAGLVGVAAIIKAEDVAQDFRRRMLSSAVLLLDGVPRVFVMVRSVVAAVGPVNGLVQVPEPGGVHAVVGRRVPRRRAEQRGQNKGASGRTDQTPPPPRSGGEG